MLPVLLHRTLLPLTLLIAAPATAMEEPSADILVIARKMRTVRLNYSLFGSHLKSCDAEVSSGDPRIDRIMCALLRQCITDGDREPRPAKACVNRRIQWLEQNVQSVGYAPDDPPEPTLAVPPQPPSPAAPALGDADIIVEGRRFDVRPGYWHFSEQKLVSANRNLVAARPRFWTVCILPGELTIALEKMLQTRQEVSAWGRCSELDYQAKDGVLTGKSKCIANNLRMTRRINGRYDAENVSLSQDIKVMALASTRSVDAPSMDAEGLVQTTGKYMGDCPDR